MRCESAVDGAARGIRGNVPKSKITGGGTYPHACPLRKPSSLT